jgi:hypothetical protein
MGSQRRYAAGRVIVRAEFKATFFLVHFCPQMTQRSQFGCRPILLVQPVFGLPGPSLSIVDICVICGQFLCRVKSLAAHLPARGQRAGSETFDNAFY